jgi:hypothetical protein
MILRQSPNLNMYDIKNLQETMRSTNHYHQLLSLLLSSKENNRNDEDNNSNLDENGRIIILSDNAITGGRSGSLVPYSDVPALRRNRREITRTLTPKQKQRKLVDVAPVPDASSCFALDIAPKKPQRK